MLGVSERAIIATAENAERSYALCSSLLSNEAEAKCLDSLISVSKTQFDNKILTSKLEEYRNQH